MAGIMPISAGGGGGGGVVSPFGSCSVSSDDEPFPGGEFKVDSSFEIVYPVSFATTSVALTVRLTYRFFGYESLPAQTVMGVFASLSDLDGGHVAEVSTWGEWETSLDAEGGEVTLTVPQGRTEAFVSDFYRGFRLSASFYFNDEIQLPASITVLAAAQLSSSVAGIVGAAQAYDEWEFAEPPAQGPLLLTATDPVSWAPAGTLPALGATRETREVNPIPDLGTYPFGPSCGTDLITTLTNLLANWDPISNGLMDPGDPAAPTDDNYRNVWEAYVTLATHVLDQMSVDMPGVWDQYNAYLEENEAPPLAMPEDGDFEGSLDGNVLCSYEIFAGYGGEGFGTLDAEVEATKGAMFTEFMRVLADNSSKEVWAFVLEGGYFDDLAEYIPAESTVETCELEWRTPSGAMLSTDGWVEVVPEPPDPLVPDARHVRWALYEDGTLVINGENEPNYNGHGTVTASCDTAAWSAEYGWNQYGLLDLDFEYGALGGGQPPWAGTENPYVELYSLQDDIHRVEFASPTSPTSMSGWFANIPCLVDVDTANLDLSTCKSMAWMFAQTYVASVDVVPSFSGWDVSHVEDLTATFAAITPAWPMDTVLDLTGWSPAPGCDASNTFSNNATLRAVWCESWDGADGAGTFSHCTNIRGSFMEFDPGMFGPEMANCWNGYFCDPSINPEQSEYPFNDVVMFATTPDLLPNNPMGWPLAVVMRDLDRYVSVNGQLAGALRSSFTDMDQLTKLDHYTCMDEFEATWKAIKARPDTARAELESLLDTVGDALAFAGISVELTDVEETEYLIYVSFTVNGNPARVSLRGPIVGGGEQDLTGLRSDIDALVRLFFMAEDGSYATLGRQYSRQVLSGGQYESIAHLFSDIGEGIFEREFSVTMESSSPTIQTVFENVYDAHDGSKGWEDYWPTDRVDQMDKQRLGEIAERLRDLSGQFISIVGDYSAEGGPLDWDVLMASGEYPEVAAL